MNFTLGGNKIDLFNPSFGAVLVIGVVHGDEPQGDYLIRKYYELCPETKLMLVPCLNPDGMESKTRTNFRGVDLNRNFPSKNWILSEKNEYFGGETPASEPETKFLIELIDKYSPKAILTLHSPYKVVNYDGPAEKLADTVSKSLPFYRARDLQIHYRHDTAVVYCQSLKN